MSFKYEPASGPLHFSVKELFSKMLDLCDLGLYGVVPVTSGISPKYCEVRFLRTMKITMRVSILGLRIFEWSHSALGSPRCREREREREEGRERESERERARETKRERERESVPGLVSRLARQGT